MKLSVVDSHMREFVSPKYITVSLYAPIYIVNAAFHSLPSLILILLYLHLRSSFVKTFFSTSSRISAIRDKKYPFFTVYWFI